jgi:menaquinone-dependent protoporphyrinogen oxidase
MVTGMSEPVVRKRVLVAYATREGQTRKIAEHVAATLRERALEVDVIDVKAAPPGLELGDYAHVVLAASVHMGKHEREMVEFVVARRAALDRIPTALLSVTLSEAGVEDPKRTPEQQAHAAAGVKEVVDRFLADTGLHPSRVVPVAGALKYREYGWLVRFVMKRISKVEGAPTDTSRDYEMTDWVALDRFGEEVAASLEGGRR